MAQTEAQRRASDRYRKKNVKTLTINFFPADLELYERAKSRDEGISAYIRRLIREDMERQAREQD